MLPTANSMEYRIVRSGYAFGGWYEFITGEDGEKELTNPVEQYAKGTTGNKEVMLKWDIETYHITYEFNGGAFAENESTATTFTVVDTVTLAEPSRRGHTFEGWYTDATMKYNRVESIAEGTASDITLYAKWSSISYTMTYHLNGSELTRVTINGVTVDSSTNVYEHMYIYNEKTTYTLLLPTRVGYTFGGWFTRDDLTGDATTEYAGSELVEDKDFYAKWVAHEYVISLDYGDIYEKKLTDPSELRISTIDIEEHNNLYALSILGVEGYTFLGWYDNDTKVSEITLANARNMSLEARFRINKLQITLLGENVSGNVNILLGGEPITTVDYGSDLEFTINIIEPKYTKSQYTVSYRYNIVNAGEYQVLTPQNGVFTLENITNNVELKIDGITLNTYKIEFASNGGSGVNSIDNITHGSTIEAPDAPTRDGYTFVGWFSDIGLNNQFEFETAITSDITLYAKWESVKHTATLKNNINAESKTIEFDIDNQGSISLLDRNFEIRGYEFKGFYLVPEGVENYTAFADGDKIENLNNIHRDCTIIAKFEVITYHIYYGIDAGDNNANNPSTYTVNNETITLQPASKNYYKFERWETADTHETITTINTGSVGDVFIVAIFSLLSDDYAVIKYYANGEFYSEVAVKKGDSISNTLTAQIDPKEIRGYTFVGYFTDGAYNTQFDMSSAIQSSISLYGKYEKEKYTVTYLSNIGEIASVEGNLTEITVDSRFNLKDAYKDGYKFEGWYTGVEISDGNYNFDNATKVVSIVDQVGDITLVAKFSIITYTIRYELNGGTLDGLVTSYTILDNSISLGTPIKSGYTFTGWTNADGEAITSIDTSLCADMVLTANYAIMTYSITYVDDKTTTENPNTYNVETQAFTPEHNDVDGYTFLGWYDNDDNKVTIIAGGMVGNITLTAKYEAIKYRITYILDGSSVVGGNPSTYTIESGVSRFNSPSKLGYTFKYWKNTADNSEVTSIAIGSMGDIVLQAVFEEVDNYVLITYYIDGNKYLYDSVTKGTTINEVLAPVKSHYTFLGWYTDATLNTPYDDTAIVTQDMQLHAKFTPVIYHITYVFKDGVGNVLTGVTNNNKATFSAEDLVGFESPSKAGYTFAGFKLGDSIITTTFGIYEDITLTGIFSIQEFSITYVLDGGTANNPSKYTIKDENIVLSDASKEGYTFLGWFDSITDEKITTIDTSSLKEYVLIAKWKSNAKPSAPSSSSSDDTNVLLTAIFVVLAICAFIGLVGAMNAIRKRKIEKSNNAQLNNMWSRVETKTKIHASRPEEEKHISSYSQTPKVGDTSKEKAEPFVMPSSDTTRSSDVTNTSTPDTTTSTTNSIDSINSAGKITPHTIERNMASNNDTHDGEEK